MTDEIEEPSYQEYLSSVIGTRITGVREEPTALWLMFSDGSALEVIAMADGFDIELHHMARVH